MEKHGETPRLWHVSATRRIIPTTLKIITGKVKNIGVSNFSIKTLTTLLQHARVVPAVNQVEAHPGLPQHELLAFCSSHEPKILLTAYSPLGKHKYAASDSDIVNIAKNNAMTEAQVLLSWAVQRGTVVVPKSVDPARIRQNLSVSSENFSRFASRADNLFVRT
jgi:glycerol 2-dehydrogenase (NADP+)